MIFTAGVQSHRTGAQARPPVKTDKDTPKPQDAPSGAASGGMGLGDAIAAVTDALGVKKCVGCAKRQIALNAIRLPFGRQNGESGQAQGRPKD